MEISQEQKKWAMFCHLSSLLGYISGIGFIVAPLLVWLLKKDENPFVDEQGKESLNFQISMLIYFAIAGVLCAILIGFFILPVLGILQLIFVIIASVKAKDGFSYRYPLTIRFIK